MYRALGDFGGGSGFTSLSFRELERWPRLSAVLEAHRTSVTPVSITAVVMGDELCGPVLLFIGLDGGVTPPDAPAHLHATDNWRMSLRGVLAMGRDRYAAGEFRFQQGWKPYASDNFAVGPDGGWTVLVFADRRGMRVRPVKKEGPALDAGSRRFGAWLGIVAGDMVSEDPADGAGDSALVTTLDRFKRGSKIDHSFSRADEWEPVESGVRVSAGLMGDPSAGPVMVLSRLAPGARSIAGDAIGSELLRIVVRGTALIDHSDTMESGDMRVLEAGADTGSVTAGPDGLDEVLVIADRRGVAPSSALGDLVGGLIDVLEESAG
jgi:hypothetical protein